MLPIKLESREKHKSKEGYTPFGAPVNLSLSEASSSHTSLLHPASPPPPTILFHLLLSSPHFFHISASKHCACEAHPSAGFQDYPTTVAHFTFESFFRGLRCLMFLFLKSVYDTLLTLKLCKLCKPCLLRVVLIPIHAYFTLLPSTTVCVFTQQYRKKSSQCNLSLSQVLAVMISNGQTIKSHNIGWSCDLYINLSG